MMFYTTPLKLVKFRRVVFDICERRDKRTYRHTHHNTSYASQEKVIIIISKLEKTSEHRIQRCDKPMHLHICLSAAIGKNQ